MKGLLIIKKLLPHKPYYISDRGYDSRIGSEFLLFLHPFSIDGGNAFYYVRRRSGGEIEIEGEGYIVTTKDSLNRHKADARRTFSGNRIWYYWLDEAGNVIQKEFISCSA